MSAATNITGATTSCGFAATTRTQTWRTRRDVGRKTDGRCTDESSWARPRRPRARSATRTGRTSGARPLAAVGAVLTGIPTRTVCASAPASTDEHGLGHGDRIFIHGSRWNCEISVHGEQLALFVLAYAVFICLFFCLFAFFLD